ncbi:unnamed protein product [Oncorhynchus mykiss]|uniref:Immunoglobulin V-set domain-containing protein n=1 Tax=Oncorhynchus mykiss TaxID=8022 RepID=A0A060YW13_ONCMY|nr:unnamed protein product [Oncorhynchus mykiss]
MNKFSITGATSSNTLFLKGQTLQTEDTAVYYCARLQSDTNICMLLIYAYYY